MGRHLAKDCVRKAGKPFATLAANQLDGVVDDGMGGDTLEVQQLKCSTQERSARPIIDLEGSSSMLRQGGFEIRDDAKRAIHDLCRERGVGAAQRSAAQLCVERGRRPRCVVKHTVQNASRELSSWGNHRRTLAWVAGRGTEIGGAAKRVIPYREWGRAAG